MTRTVNVITPRTDAEWPVDHPLRRAIAGVTTHAQSARADFLICTRVGEERAPPPADDFDIEASCSSCGVGVKHRASAPKEPKRICLQCWAELSNERPQRDASIDEIAAELEKRGATRR